jgi:hypothetical protein
MEIYTAIPLIPSSATSNSPRMERIHSRAARSLLKVLLFLITLLAVLSVIIVHAMHKQNSSKSVYSFEEILGEKETLPAVRFAEEKPDSFVREEGLSSVPEVHSAQGGLRGFSNGPVVHRVIMVHPARVMDVDSTPQMQFFSEFERDVMQVFNAMEHEMQQTMNSVFGPLAGANFGTVPALMDDFFKGPLSGFEEIPRPCAMVRDASMTRAVVPVAEAEESVEEEEVDGDANASDLVSNVDLEEDSHLS